MKSTPQTRSTRIDRTKPASWRRTLAGLLAGAALALLTALHPACAEAPRAPSRAAPAAPDIRPSPEAAASIGQLIWKNESGGTIAGLTGWNRGEYFASLGIGHFIWYHPEARGPFEESFPRLLTYIRSRSGAPAPPAWLAQSKGCPWRTYEEFHAAKDSARMVELREYLAATVPQQTEFLVRRLERALPKMLAVLEDAAEKNSVRDRFYSVAESPQGTYALIDYVNFKGEGIKAEERYRGQGWGLLQVLQEMQGQPRGAGASREFSESAKRVLARRVRNAPREESQWLKGWFKRCDTYARPL